MPSRPDSVPDRHALLARLLARRGIAVGERDCIPVRPPGAPARTSFAQQRLWFVHELDPAGAAYTLAQAIEIEGDLRIDALERALRAIAARHEPLRSSFTGSVDLRILPSLEGLEILPITDLTGTPFDDRRATLEALTREWARRPFDLASAPLWRAHLVKHAAREFRLLLAAHHVVLDGWSLAIFVSELADLYRAHVEGSTPTVAPLSVQYADYAEWQRQAAEAGTFDEGLSYWENRLAGVPVLELPGDRRRPAAITSAGALHRFRWSADLVRRVRAFASAEQVTPYMVYVAAFGALLQRYSGQQDLAIGTPVAGRPHVELEGLIGLFANMIVLRLDLARWPTFRELVARVRATSTDAYAHQDVPFEQLVDRIQPSRSLAHHPLFQVAFTMQNAPAAEWALPGVSLRLLPAESAGAKFDLTVAIEETGGELNGSAEYRTDLFGAPFIAGLVGHYRCLLEAGCSAPDTVAADLQILGDDEASLVLRSPVEHTAHDERCLHELFAEQAARTPRAIAVTDGPRQMTYGELDERSGQLAAELRARGIGVEDLVAVFLERSADLVVAILGVLRAGAAYVPIDPSYPVDRIGYMIADSRATVLVTEARLRARCPGGPRHVLCVDEVELLTDRSGRLQPADRPPNRRRQGYGGPPQLYAKVEGGRYDRHEQDSRDDTGETASHRAAHPDSAAYVIYTSGSTGRPKGVVVTHRNVTRLFLSATERLFDFGEGDVWTLFHSYAFDFSVWEMWGALLYGGRLVIVPYWVSRTVDQFYELLAREGVTVLSQTPSAFRQVVNYERPLASPGSLSLRYVIFGGEALDIPSLAPWFERHGDERPVLVNMYGITETTVHVTFRRITAADVAAAAGSLIGLPLRDLVVRLVDERLNPVPIGVPGEILVGGAGVARGYLGRSELTAARFIPDPLGSAGEVLYRSGDLARWLSDGTLEYLGRIDHQVKVRGFRIELGEIEAALSEHPAVAEAVVTARPAHDGETQLVAYVTLSSSSSSSSSSPSPLPSGERVGPAGEPAIDLALRTHLHTRLPEYMVPSAFVLMDALPLTAHGKIDRRALPDPARVATESAGYQPPSNDAERDLAEIWQQVLGVPRIGATDNFFALGGDSIRSLQVRVLARARGYDFALPDLFQHQTVETLARVMGRTEPERRGRTREPFALVAPADRERLAERAEIEDAYPVAALQGGMLFHEALAPESATYRDLFSYHLRVDWNEGALRAAMVDVVAHHAVLRTSFDWSGFTEPLQIVHRRAEPRLEIDDLSGMEPDKQDRLITAWIDREHLQPFDLNHPPLVRVHVHRRTDSTLQFSLSVHHAILDGWSLAMLLAEIFERYLGRSGGTNSELEADRTAYRDFIELERATVGDVEPRRFWAGKVLDVPVLTLPAHRDLVQTQTQAQRQGEGKAKRRGVYVRHARWNRELVDRLKSAGARSGTSLKSVLLSAHLAVLGYLANQEDVVTGLVANGRPEQADADRVLGLFLNTVPLRVRLAGGTWLDLQRAAFEAERELLPFRRFPLTEIQKLGGRGPLFETAFNFVHFHVFEALVRRTDFELLAADYREQTNFALFVQFAVDVQDEGLQLTLDFDATSFAEAQADEIASYFRRAVEALAADPAARYDSRPWLSSAEVRRLLVEFNETAREHDRTRTLHGLFEVQAARTPDAVALVAGHHRVRYGELQARAAACARLLAARSTCPETRVGICLPRSANLVIAMLGVLEAGGVYVPLDPAYPPARIAATCLDAGLRLVLTESTYADLIPDAIERLEVGSAAETSGARATGGSIVSAAPENLAYLIYTSGSTGRPKGVAIEHRSAVALVHWAQDVFGSESLRGVLASTSICFDLSVFEIFATLASGGTVVLADTALDLPRLPARDEVTLVNTVPSAMAELVRQRAIPPTVRTVNLAGEPLAASLVDAVYDCGVSEVYDLYGPSEDTTYSTYTRRQRRGPETIGRPIANTQAYLLDGRMRPVPLGGIGEIYIGGEGVARGYWGRADATAERFLPDPFSARPGARLYRTGDLARYLPDGRLVFLGRTDQQMKVRGFRIEPGEIVAALEAQPSVAEACVTAHEDETGRKRLVAYVVPRSEIDLSAIRAALAVELPDFLIPTSWVRLEKLPRTPNGKLDRRALPAPEEVPMATRAPYSPPRTPIESTLARIWADVLKVPRVGRDDNFFMLGGDSILLLQIVARARAEGISCPAQHILQDQTIARIAGRVAAVDDERRAEVVTGAAVLTPIQRWFFEQRFTEPRHWNQSLLLEVHQPLEPARLNAAFEALVRHHDGLRMRFGAAGADAGQGEEWSGVIDAAEASGHALSSLDLRATPDDKIDRAVEAICAVEQAGMNLEQGPLVRAAYLDFGPARPGRLFIAIHHLVVDGVSWRILLEDLWSAYKQMDGSARPALPAKTLSYKEWADALSALAAAPDVKREGEYWIRLAAEDVTPLPRDFPAGADENTEAATQVIARELDETSTERLLRDLPPAYGTQVNDVLVAALGETLARWTGRATHVIALEGHGREPIGEADVSRTVGWFTTMFPVRLATPGGSVANRLATARAQLRAVPRRGFTYGLLRYLSPDERLRRVLASTPSPEMVFNYLGQFDQTLDNAPAFGPAREHVGPVYGPLNRRPYLIEVTAVVYGGRLRIEWRFSAAHHRLSTIESLAERYVGELGAIVHSASKDEAEANAVPQTASGVEPRELDAALEEIDLA